MEEEVSKLLQNFEKKLNEMHERMCSLEKENAQLVSRTKEMVEDQVNNEVTIELLQARVVDLENWKATNPI
jgi:predicted transcriptional regulator